ncbi:MAG: hypothetical protein RBT71_00635 [Flavobacteriales bacterium]|jgi:hypothetical protein|nr:hypothetical protein [Flavobacteriales bacterium]
MGHILSLVRKSRAWRHALAVALLGLAVPAGAQDVVYIFGTVKDYFSSKKLDNVTVTVYKDGGLLTEVRASGSGKYELNLDYGADYKLIYSRPGMVSKIIAMDTRNVPEEERLGGHGFNLEMTLFNDMPGVDFSVLQQPIGKAKYDMAKAEVTWDLAYTEQIRNEVNRLMKEYADRQKAEAGAEAEFAKLMKQGDAAMSASDYAKAVGAFTGAVGIKPDDAVANAKLSDARMRLEQAEAEKNREGRYADLIKDADALFNKNDLAPAREKYTEALKVKDEAPHPTARIKEIDRLLAEQAKKAEEERLAKELQDKYDAAISAADKAFDAQRWDEATGHYTEASGLKAGEKYPKDQLALIVRKKQEEAEQAEKDRQEREQQAAYDAAITAGDKAFDAQDWDRAEGHYTQAAALKPSEKYPPDQLAAIAQKRQEQAEQAEREKQEREQQAAYDGAIAQGDLAFNARRWDEAVGHYTKAAGMKPSEKYPPDQLAAIEQKRQEEADQAEREKQEREQQAAYDAAIARADVAFDGKQWDQARAAYTEAADLKPSETYPTERLRAIDRALEEEARVAEELRKQQELDERYAALIATADKAFADQEWSAALNDYTDARQLKPAEAHPSQRIAEIEGLLDAEARAQAEQERLERERQERDQRYADLVATADAQYDDDQLAQARGTYVEALAIKADEPHPADRIAAIDAELARRAEADSLAVAAEAERLREQALADSLAAVAAEAERLAELERQRLADAEAFEQAYAELVATADVAYAADELEQARERYTDALGMKPDQAHPAERIAAIDAELERRAQDRLAADALAEERARLEQERLRREQEEADALRAAQDEQARLREEERAREQQYRERLIEADAALAAMEYDEARGLYGQAADMRPEDSYPISKIEQIDKILADLERQRQEEALAAQRAEEAARAAMAAASTTIDTRKEQEAEQFMRAAREREENEKYDRIRKLRTDLALAEAAQEEQAEERRMGELERNRRLTEPGAGLYAGDDELARRNTDELDVFRDALARAEAERRARARSEQQAGHQRTLDRQDAVAATVQTWDERHAQRSAQAADDARAHATAQGDRDAAGRERSAREHATVESVAEAQRRMQERGDARIEANAALVDAQKRARQVREAGYATGQQNRALEAVRNDAAGGSTRGFAETNRSKLASEYPQGVTEESYTEGNKVIIRRVVVDGDRADEYSKVIAKWGIFYFKNGHSISEAVWGRETDR